MTENEEETIPAVLAASLEQPAAGRPLDSTDRDHMDILMTGFEEGRNTAAVHVLATLAAKKIISPDQDIRLHKRKLKGGFSGRKMDSGHVTPFLLKRGLTTRPSSGWQTYSMQWNHPYEEDYPGAISPGEVKTALLFLVRRMQTKEGLAQRMLAAVLAKLVEIRDIRRPKLAKPHQQPRGAHANVARSGGDAIEDPDADAASDPLRQRFRERPERTETPGGEQTRPSDQDGGGKAPVRDGPSPHPRAIGSERGTQWKAGAGIKEEAAPREGNGTPRKQMEIEQTTFLRLARFARPLEDTVDSVVNRALDALEELEAPSNPNRGQGMDA